MSLPRRIWSSLGPARPAFVGSMAATFVEGLMQVVPPLAIGLGLARLAEGGARMADLAPYAAAIVVAVVVRLVVIRVAWRFGFSAGTAATGTIRNRIVDHMRRTPLGIYKRWSAAKLASLLTEDCRWLNDVSTFTFSRVLAGTTMVVLLVVAIIWLDMASGIATLTAFVAGFLLMPVIHRMFRRLLASRNVLISDLLHRVGEYGDGIMVFQSFNSTASAFKAYSDVVEQLRRLTTRAIPSIISVGEVGNTLFGLATALAITFAALAPIAGFAEPQAVLLIPALFLTLAARNALMLEIVKQGPLVELASRGEKNISRFLAEPILDGTPQVFAAPYDIDVTGMSFQFPGSEAQALSDIAFRAAAGSVTAIVGPSGAGKSTIISLLMRFFDVDRGRISIGGVDIRTAEPASLQSLVSLVNQDVHLFRDTLRANILLGDPSASEARLMEVIRASRLDQLVAALPDGLDTMLGDTGRTLSGGERQRVAIARALLKDAPIVVLDEATSAMDPLTERAIQEAFSALERGRTVIIIAHRLRTIAKADQILVLEGGRIVERGGHDALLANEGLYARLWRAQERAVGWRIR